MDLDGTQHPNSAQSQDSRSKLRLLLRLLVLTTEEIGVRREYAVAHSCSACFLWLQLVRFRRCNATSQHMCHSTNGRNQSCLAQVHKTLKEMDLATPVAPDVEERALKALRRLIGEA